MVTGLPGMSVPSAVGLPPATLYGQAGGVGLGGLGLPGMRMDVFFTGRGKEANVSQVVRENVITRHDRIATAVTP